MASAPRELARDEKIVLLAVTIVFAAFALFPPQRALFGRGGMILLGLAIYLEVAWVLPMLWKERPRSWRWQLTLQILLNALFWIRALSA